MYHSGVAHLLGRDRPMRLVLGKHLFKLLSKVSDVRFLKFVLGEREKVWFFLLNQLDKCVFFLLDERAKTAYVPSYSSECVALGGLAARRDGERDGLPLPLRVPV